MNPGDEDRDAEDRDETAQADSHGGGANDDPETEGDTASGGAAEPPDPA